TAWYLNHRIREVMVEGAIPMLGGVVEIDETYIGGKQRGWKKKLKNKQVVMGIRERGGDLRLKHIANNSVEELGKQIKEHISPEVKMVVSDEFIAYPAAMISAGIHGTKHETIQ